MHAKLLERLDALAGVLDKVRGKIASKEAHKLDGLTLARTLEAVDAAARKVAAVEDKAVPVLFDEKAG
jgi:hypothetical protein